MNSILDKIIDYKLVEVAERKERTSIKELAENEFFQAECHSFSDFLIDEERTGIVAEFCFKS